MGSIDVIINQKSLPHSEEKRNMEKGGEEMYEDLLPVMAEKLDGERFMAELCGGFRLLAEEGRGVITAESLRRNSRALGMKGEMGKEEAEAMVREGDLDGDGALNEMEFCILMVRLSPGFMEDAESWLERALQEEGEQQLLHSNRKLS